MLFKVDCYSFSAVPARSIDCLTDDKSLIKTKLNRLINSLLPSAINNKERYITWYMKVHSEEYSTCCMKVIWKIQYKFADAKIN